MSNKRKICVVTGSRAEYGSLYWLMKEIQSDSKLALQLVVTGSHLSPEFGSTYQIIENDDFTISAKVEMLLSSDSPVGISKSIGLGVIGFAEALERLHPDVIVVLGDRYEILAAVQAALVAKVPVAHLHGGEITEGAIDDAIRHAITKMAHLHFVGAEPYRQRVIQLGEDPSRVFNYGAIQLDFINKLTLLSLEEFEKAIDFRLGKINFLVTYHPVTLSQEAPTKGVKSLLEALDHFNDAHIIFTGNNSDTNGRVVGKMITDYVERYPVKAKHIKSLGQLKYLSAISHTDAVIGNSSSGLSEVPVMKKPTINIGIRQDGRLKAKSVINCKESKEAIIDSINKALSPKFKKLLCDTESIYGSGETAPRIKETLKNVNLEGILLKKFYSQS
jgi:UDP-hydrolysing UDP-N-acetyl-D-glucosamine 2-epimerase